MLSDVEREYSPSSVLTSLNTTIETEIGRYVSMSDEAYETYRFVELPYGPNPRNHLLVLAQDQPPKRALLYVHGGYWQELSARQSLFSANDAVKHGLGFASIGYTLAPDISLRAICDEVVAACKAFRQTFPATEIILAGSSAGAHLCAWVLHHEPQCIDQVILLSGIYDLRPLVDTYINEKVGLSRNEAALLSPVLLPRPLFDHSKLVVAVAEHDTLTFRDQADRYAAHVNVTCTHISNRNHFDLPFELGRWLDEERISL